MVIHTREFGDPMRSGISGHLEVNQSKYLTEEMISWMRDVTNLYLRQYVTTLQNEGMQREIVSAFLIKFLQGEDKAIDFINQQDKNTKEKLSLLKHHLTYHHGYLVSPESSFKAKVGIRDKSCEDATHFLNTMIKISIIDLLEKEYEEKVKFSEHSKDLSTEFDRIKKTYVWNPDQLKKEAAQQFTNTLILLVAASIVMTTGLLLVSTALTVPPLLAGALIVAGSISASLTLLPAFLSMKTLVLSYRAFSATLFKPKETTADNLPVGKDVELSKYPI